MVYGQNHNHYNEDKHQTILDEAKENHNHKEQETKEVGEIKQKLKTQLKKNVKPNNFMAR